MYFNNYNNILFKNAHCQYCNVMYYIQDKFSEKNDNANTLSVLWYMNDIG